MDADAATYGSEDVRVLPSETQDKRDNALSTRLGRNEWLAAEQPLPPMEKKVVACLLNLGKGISTMSQLDMEYVAMGDGLYIAFRKMLNTSTMLLVEPRKLDKDTKSGLAVGSKDQRKPKGPKKGRSGGGLSAAEIRINNGKSRAEKMIMDTIASFSSHQLDPFAAFSNDIIEIRGIGLLYAAWFVLSHREKYAQNYEVTYGLIIAIERFIGVCDTLSCKSIMGGSDDVFVAKELLLDLAARSISLAAVYKYSGENVIHFAPTLLSGTDFDMAIPKTEIRPRQHQVDLYNSVKKFHVKGFCLTYNPQIGSGKTTSIVALAGWVMDVRRRAGFKNFQLLFVCNNLGVRDYASQLCYNAQIPFGIGSRHKDETLGLFKVTQHNSCVKKDGTDCVVIIADPESAYEILMAPDSMEENEKLLFLDEPTIGADTADSASLRANIQLMMAQPKRTIYCSATFPSFDLMRPLLQYQRLKHDGIELGSVYSGEIYIGCTISTYEGELVIPYMGVKTQEQLKTVIQAVHDNPMLGRSYVTKVAHALWKAMTRCGIADVPNIDEYFLDFENLRTDKPRQIVVSMLTLLAAQTDDIIEIVCRSALTDELIKDVEPLAGAGTGPSATGVVDDELGIVWSSVPDGEDTAADHVMEQKLGTTQAYRFLGATLIATDDPVRFAREQFASLLTAIKTTPLPRKTNSPDEAERLIDTASKLILCYSNELDTYNKKAASIVRNVERGSGIPEKHARPDVACDRKMASKLHKVSRDVQGDALLSAKLQEHQATAPVYHFPECCQINTPKHMQKYARSHIHKIVPSFMRKPIPLHTINFKEFTVHDDLILLLMAGVGIFSVALDDASYRGTVLSLASTGKLAYLIADESICFGTNFPINHVIIARDFNHSLCTCLQALGRAGRPGKSPTADAIVPQSFAEALIAYTRNPTAPTRESINMMGMFSKLFAEKRANLMAKVSDLPQMRIKFATILAARTSPSSSPSKPVVVEDAHDDADDTEVPVPTTAVWGADDEDVLPVPHGAKTLRIHDLVKREETQRKPHVATSADISTDWRAAHVSVPAPSKSGGRATDLHHKTDDGPAGAGSGAKYVPPALRGASGTSRGMVAPTTRPSWSRSDGKSGSDSRNWRS